MDTPGLAWERFSSRRAGPLPRPVSSHYRRTFAGSGGLLCRHQFWIPAYSVSRRWLPRPDLLVQPAPRASAIACDSPSHWIVPRVFVASTSERRLFRLPRAPLCRSEPNNARAPYLLRTAAPRTYNLDDSIQERNFAVSAAPLTREDLTNGATRKTPHLGLARARTPTPADPGLRPYYTCRVDIDRYLIDGVERQVMITARELNVEKLPDQAKVWVNLALKYTHGYGAVASGQRNDSREISLWGARYSSPPRATSRSSRVRYTTRPYRGVYVRSRKRNSTFHRTGER